ncbi:Bax inhibitor-1/YccA family protein [Streptomyces sp. NPDC051362]|uniref:Bax inhibitor-1/YccA family protein n=1 Tax=Streptomyces sp. NPDC051362 TaxID=3365651 RepID=UPI0037B19A7E
MKSSNPVFTRRRLVRSTEPQMDTRRELVGVSSTAAMGDRLDGSYSTNGSLSLLKDPLPVSAAMTIDDVVVRTALALGTAILTAALSWVLLPVDKANIGGSYGLAAGAAVVAFVLSMVQAFRRRPSPALILGYAAFEGVFLGVISEATSTYLAPGVIVQSVLGTFAVFAGVLISYRMGWIRVTRRFVGFVLAAATGFLLLAAADLVLSALGVGGRLGLDGGGLGIVFGIAGIVLGACFLALDFKHVEDAIAYGAPREESWMAAFGLTTTLIWIYLEVLRVLSLFRDDV